MNVHITDQKICGPDGSITIGPNDVQVNGVPDPAHANFVFEWRQGSAAGAVVGVNADVIGVSVTRVAILEYVVRVLIGQVGVEHEGKV